MKAGGLIMMIVVLVAAYFLWNQLGGDVSGTAPNVGRPDVDLPDPNQAGDRARDAGNRAADEVGSWSLNTWKMILIGLLAVWFTYLWYRNPRFKYILIGILVGIVIFIGFIPQFR